MSRLLIRGTRQGCIFCLWPTIAGLWTLALLASGCGNNASKSGALPTPTELGTVIVVSPLPTNTQVGDELKICHATGSPDNPFAEMTVAASNLDPHWDHGDIIPAPPEGCPGAHTPVPTSAATRPTTLTPGTPLSATSPTSLLAATAETLSITPVPGEAQPGSTPSPALHAPTVTPLPMRTSVPPPTYAATNIPTATGAATNLPAPTGGIIPTNTAPPPNTPAPTGVPIPTNTQPPAPTAAPSATLAAQPTLTLVATGTVTITVTPLGGSTTTPAIPAGTPTPSATP